VINAQKVKDSIITIGVFDNAPQIFQDKNGNPEGVFMDILKEIEKKENLKFEYQFDNWNNLYKKLQNGTIDILPDVTYLDKRAQDVTYNKVPVVNSWIEIYSKEVLNVNSITDIQNLKIGVIKGSINDFYMRESIPYKFNLHYKLYTYENYETLVNAFENNKVDLIVSDRFFRFSDNFNNKIKPTGIILRTTDLHFAFQKNKNPKLVELFDRNISSLKNDSNSVYYQALFKWLNKDVNRLLPSYIIWLFLGIISFLIITISFIFLLKKTVKNKTKELFEAKNKAEESEQQLKSISNNFANGMIYQVAMLDEYKRKFNYVSDNVSKLYGCTAEEALENPRLLYEKIHPEDVSRLIAEEKKSLINMSFFSIEARVINPDGSTRWSYYLSKPRKINGTICWDGIEIDISDRKKMEFELQNSKEKAEESDRLKSAFLANMSHEIRTPMNGILGFAELLKEPNLQDKDHKKYIKIIEKSGKRMLNIINDIVNISKIESGLMEINLEECQINEKLKQIHSIFSPEAEKKGITLGIQKSFYSTEAIIISDREKLFAILTNLVSNAIKYTNQGHIEIGYNIKDNLLEFYVKDTGIGIPKERQQAIFERFVQGDIMNKMAFQGTGLGLSITKAYAEMLGGKIWLESELGQGSTFYFSTKYNKQIILEKNQGKVLSLPTYETLSTKLKILIVEDDKMSALLLTKLVKNYSYEILKAKDGLEAVSMYMNNPEIDLILMDIQMPNMNGHEATKAIRKIDQNVIIIAQTAYALIGDKEKALESGCNECIPKPINRELLVQLIFKHFEKDNVSC
jgi:PAS domain S-box-containing protein